MKQPMPQQGKKTAHVSKVTTLKQNRQMSNAEWVRGMRLNAYTVTLLAVIVLGVLTLAPRVQDWFILRQQVAQAQADVANARAEVKGMVSERKRWEDPVYIRAQARDRLYYVMPGEVSYLVMDAEGVDASDVSGTVGAMLADQRNYSQISKGIHQTRSNWVDSIIKTVIVAGIDEPNGARN